MKNESLVERSSALAKVLVAIPLVLAALTTLLPLWNTLIMSFTSDMESLEVVLKMWPREPAVASYVFLLTRVRLLRPFLNNILVTVTGTMLFVVANTCAGFVLSRPRFPGRALLALAFVLPMMIPGEAIIIPRYITMKHLGLIDSLWSVILEGVGSTFAIYLMRSYFLSVPRSLEDSAHIDGAGVYRLLGAVYVPLSTAGLATITLIEVVGKWNHLFSAILYLHTPTRRTLQQAIQELIRQGESSLEAGVIIPPNARAAAIIVSLVPMLMLYPLIQRYFIKGIYLGALKE